MRCLRDEHNDGKACNDAAPHPTLQNGMQRIYLATPLMPKRGPRYQLGYHRVFNLILWVLYTEMSWKCLPIPKDIYGKAAIHYTTIDKVFAT
jgi:hypothetical protein